MSKSFVRGAVYDPPEATMPFIGLVITPEGNQSMATFSTRAQAEEFVERHKQNYVSQLSVVGRGIRSQTPGTD